MFQHKDWPLWVLLVLFVISAIVIYPYLPEQVPSHWNLEGEVDSYSSRAFGAFFPPSLALGMYLLMLFIPRLDPKGANYIKYGKAWDAVRWSLVLFMLLIGLITWATALGWPVPVSKIILAAVALLFIVLGNYLPKIRYQNYTLGIRTPWTLESEVVWRETHRLGGLLMVVGGFVALFGLLLSDKAAFILLLLSIFIPVIIATVYSYIRFNQLEK